MALTAQYLEDHIPVQGGTKTNDFGLKMTEIFLKEGTAQLTQLKSDSADKINFNANVTLEENVAGACVSITVCLPFVGCHTVHVGVG
ncbi:hypothetical protein [Spirosoma pulveris]